ncbi:MAG: histidine kinase, partial [Aeromicrobium erythreum]
MRALLGTPTVGLTDTTAHLAWDGPDDPDDPALADVVAATLRTGRTQAAGPAVAAPLVVDERVIGALVVVAEQPSAGLLRATAEVAAWMSGQLELAELDKSRTALMAAELRALRAQISPHFVYNSLGAIASFVR